MESILKHSKIIIVLLILYTAIAIAVVTMDRSINSSKKEKEKKPVAVKVSDEDFEKFNNEIEYIKGEIQNYLSTIQVTEDMCIPLSTIIPTKTDYSNAETGEPVVIEYTGSVYVTSDLYSVKLWHKSSDLYLAVNNVEINGTTLTKDDVEDDYTTEYYNSCGFSK